MIYTGCNCCCDPFFKREEDMMSRIKRILTYIENYGIRSALSLFFEKNFQDKRRFSGRVRPVPEGMAPPTARVTGSETSQTPSMQGGAAEHLTSLSGERILLLVHYFYPERAGGTERFTYNLAKELMARGAFVRVLVLDASLPRSAYTEICGDILLREFDYDGIPCTGFRYRRSPKGLYYKNISLEDEKMRVLARHVIKRDGISLVHATYPQPFGSFLCECHALEVPYIVTCTDFAMVCRYATMVDKRGALCPGSATDGCAHGSRCEGVCRGALCTSFAERHERAELILRRAAAVTVPSEFSRAVISREFPGVDPIRISHGISEDFLSAPDRKGVRTFLYAGTLAPLKGVHILLRAFSKLDGDYRLIISGKGSASYLRRLRRMADSRVEFIGPTSAKRMAELYAAADCVVIPSLWYETYNFVLREAQSGGALVVASNIGAMPESVSTGRNGFLFTPGDIDSLYTALLSASRFDFSDYERASHPTPSGEGEEYLALILRIKNSDGKFTARDSERLVQNDGSQGQ